MHNTWILKYPLYLIAYSSFEFLLQLFLCFSLFVCALIIINCINWNHIVSSHCIHLYNRDDNKVYFDFNVLDTVISLQVLDYSGAASPTNIRILFFRWKYFDKFTNTTQNKCIVD